MVRDVDSPSRPPGYVRGVTTRCRSGEDIVSPRRGSIYHYSGGHRDSSRSPTIGTHRSDDRSHDRQGHQWSVGRGDSDRVDDGGGTHPVGGDRQDRGDEE